MIATERPHRARHQCPLCTKYFEVLIEGKCEQCKHTQDKRAKLMRLKSKKQ